MKVDIDKLTEGELVDLNRRIVERLRFLQQMRAHSKMLEFRLGDRVTFQPENRLPVSGIITKYNKKTVSILSDDGVQWNVSPGFLSPVRSREVHETNNDRVIPIK